MQPVANEAAKLRTRAAGVAAADGLREGVGDAVTDPVLAVGEGTAVVDCDKEQLADCVGTDRTFDHTAAVGTSSFGVDALDQYR